MINLNAYTESDWKLFRSRIADWQERYMERLSKEYIDLLSRDENPSENFWALEDRIRSDKKKIGVSCEMSRSQLVYNMAMLAKDGAITEDDLDGFSEELQENIMKHIK